MKNLANKYKKAIPQDIKSNSTSSGPSQANHFQIISDINSYANIQEFSDSSQHSSSHHAKASNHQLFYKDHSCNNDTQFQHDLFHKPIYEMPQDIRINTEINNKNKEKDKFWEMLRNYQEEETQMKGSQRDFHEKQTFPFRRDSYSKEIRVSIDKQISSEANPIVQQQEEQIQDSESSISYQQQQKIQVIHIQKAVNKNNPFVKRKRRYSPEKKQKEIKWIMQEDKPKDFGRLGYSSSLEFVEFQQPQYDPQRRYPLRMSRMAPLKPYFCERIDYNENGYWIQKEE